MPSMRRKKGNVSWHFYIYTWINKETKSLDDIISKGLANCHTPWFYEESWRQGREREGLSTDALSSVWETLEPERSAENGQSIYVTDEFPDKETEMREREGSGPPDFQSVVSLIDCLTTREKIIKMNVLGFSREA